jgi:hypothetical protein
MFRGNLSWYSYEGTFSRGLFQREFFPGELIREELDTNQMEDFSSEDVEDFSFSWVEAVRGLEAPSGHDLSSAHLPPAFQTEGTTLKMAACWSLLDGWGPLKFRLGSG